MASRILQVAYYPELSHTRELILRRDGYDVVSAAGNDQAMSLATAEAFDLVVVGFSADHVTRTQMVRWLKQHVPGVRVVALLKHDNEQFPDADCSTTCESPAVWLAAVANIVQQ